MNLPDRRRFPRDAVAAAAAAPPFHGGQLLRAARLYSRAPEEWIDLSTALNPRPWPLPSLPEALFQQLPQGDERLEAAARRYYRTAGVVAAAGSQALIQCLPQLRPPCRVRICATGYQEHAHHWGLQGHRVELYDETPGLHLHTPVMEPPPDVLIVINPNGHNAVRVSPRRLLEWWWQLRPRGGWLIVDEAFADPAPWGSVAPWVGRPGLVVLRSFGKFFGLAGVRLGFALCAAPLGAELRHRLGPWPVSGPARRIGELALADTAWQQRTRPWLRAACRRLEAMLRAHLGAYPVREWRRTGLAVHLRLEHAAAAEIQHRLALAGVLLRRIPTSSGQAWLRCGLYDDQAPAISQRVAGAFQWLAAARNPPPLGRGGWV